MAKFRLEPMVTSDFSLMLTPSNRRGGDLTTAPVSPLCWPVSEDDDEAALQRLEYSTLQLKKYHDVDPTAHMLKVVAVESGEIVSVARWNFFPRGYDFEANEPVDVGEFVPESAREVFNLDLYRDLRTHMMRIRRDWMQKGPCWVLMGMVTRQGYRKQGTASMLIRWGVERADRDGIPAFLEASASGKPVYQRCGFQQVGELIPWDCKPYGPDVVFDIAKMAYYPSPKNGEK